MRGKLIVIEGTDCSGKETQTNKLMEKLNNDGIKIVKYCYPNYDSPTGKIVGGPYLGKKYICDGWFSEGATNVDPKVASLYYAADRRYDLVNIKEKLDNGYNVILDRYVYSNMGHQGGKILDKEERFKMYEWLETLEFKLLELEVPDIRLFLHMPYDAALELRKGRLEEADQHEASKEHLINAENSYLEIAKKYDFKTIECVNENGIRSIDEINDEIYNFVKKKVR